MNIAIYTLTSELHDEQAVGAVTREFLDSLDVAYELKGNDYADYGSHSLSLIYVRTGGTEGIFRRLLPELQRKSSKERLFMVHPTISRDGSEYWKRLVRPGSRSRGAGWASSASLPTG